MEQKCALEDKDMCSSIVTYTSGKSLSMAPVTFV